MKTWFLFLSLILLNSTPLFADSGSYPKVETDLAKLKIAILQLDSNFQKIPADSSNIDWVKSKIAHMFGVDQYLRKFIRNIPYENQYTSEEKSVFKEMANPILFEADHKNTNDLKSLLNIYSWFNISRFGEVTDIQAWVLVQHADDDIEFQKGILDILEGLVKINESDPGNFAYLFDRVATSWNDDTKQVLQRYGTQGGCSFPGNWEPFPIENPEQVNERRAEVGLEPLEQYKLTMNTYCH